MVSGPIGQDRTEYVLLGIIFALLTSMVAQALANWISVLRPEKYDLYVFRLDALFGQPSFRLGRLVQLHLIPRSLVSISYEILPMMAAGVFVLYLYRRSDEVRLFLYSFLANLFLAVPLYLIFPVSGPAFAFPLFPQLTPVGPPHMIPITAAPNGVPSVHMSSALLLLWFLRKWRPGLAVGVLFAALTAMATLASGQHYATDLVCAVPFATAVYILSRVVVRKSARRKTDPAEQYLHVTG